jgi:hypothetical protein
MTKISLLFMAAVCLSMTAHEESGSLGHELNSDRWVTLKISEDEEGYKKIFCTMLKGIGTEENVQFSRPKGMNDHGEKVLVLLSTPTAQNRSVKIIK